MYILLQLTSSSAKEIKVTHTTPVHHYTDDLTMDFTDAGGMCTVDVCYSTDIKSH